MIKAAAATPKLMVHTGRAVVFEDVEDMTNRIDDPDLDVTADDILVMRNAGPKGHPGMPEAGLLPIPKKLAQQGVTDMIRISDARMSGTAYGTIVLHVTPEAAEGSPLALVRSATASASTCRTGGSTCWWTRRSSPNGGSRGESRSTCASASAAIASSTSTT